MALICNEQSAPHTDDKDTEYGWVAMFCHGNFTGGNLILPQLNLAIEYRPGMLIYLRSNLLHHYISKFKGTRIGMVNFTHDQDVTVLQNDLQARVNGVKWEELKVKRDLGRREKLWEPKKEGPAKTTKPNKKMREKYRKRNRAREEEVQAAKGKLTKRQKREARRELEQMDAVEAMV